MMQVPDEEYQKMKHDADDNNSIRFIVKCIVGLIVALTLYFTVGVRILNTWVGYYQDSVQCRVEEMRARNDVLIREIQSSGMEMDDYLEWYKIYSESH